VQSVAPGTTSSINSANPSIQVQGVYLGSVPEGQPGAEPIKLSLEEAVRRGILYNLGSVSADQATRLARGQRLAAVAQILPDVTGELRESIQQINLAAQGFRISVPIPNFRFPSVVGPFNSFDARARMTESLSITGLRNWRASQQNVASAEYSAKDSREIVVLAVAGSYLQLVAAAARIQSAQAQLNAARAIYDQAVDRNRSGVNARIDVNRTQVELQVQQQRLTSLTNDFEKQKLALARLIGLPLAQRFTVGDSLPFRDLPEPSVADLLRTLNARPDIQAAEAQVKAAQLTRSAAAAEMYPALEVAADYGANGINPSSQAHGTFAVSGGVRFPIFRSGRIRADIEQADAALAQRKAEAEDLKGRAEQDLRNAALDLSAATQQVRVANSNRALAAETLEQARDRFRAGVADTVEVVQAQQAVATAELDYITSLFAWNLARVSIARAIGQTEQGLAQMLGGR